MVQIGIAEDVPGLAEALRTKVQLDPEFSVRWMAPNGKIAIEQLEATGPVDLLLMDIQMPGMNGIDATRAIKEKWPTIPIVMSTVMDDADHILQAILAGASGYLLKDTRPREIHQAIREALAGGAPMSPMVATKALALIRRNQEAPQQTVAQDHNLTAREQEILECLVEGLTYQQIADRLFISYGTVRKHVENIYRKLEVHSKVEAIRKVQQGR